MFKKVQIQEEFSLRVVVHVWNPNSWEAEAGRITSLKPAWAIEWERASHTPKYFVLWVWIKIYLVVSIQRQTFQSESLPLWKCHFCSSTDFCFVCTEYVHFLHFVVRLQLRGSIMWAQGGTSCFMLHYELWCHRLWRKVCQVKWSTPGFQWFDLATSPWKRCHETC